MKIPAFWSAEIECPDPGTIRFGSSRYLESTQVGGSVTFRCRSGYRLQGSAVRHCMSNGRWNGTLTTCDHESEFPPSPGHNGGASSRDYTILPTSGPFPWKWVQKVLPIRPVGGTCPW